MTWIQDALKVADESRNKSPSVTCPASRHVHLMAEALAQREIYHPFADEPEDCADSLLCTITALWEARRKIAALEADAARYRELKKHIRTFSLKADGQHVYSASGTLANLRGPTLDAALDAMKGGA